MIVLKKISCLQCRGIEKAGGRGELVMTNWVERNREEYLKRQAREDFLYGPFIPKPIKAHWPEEESKSSFHGTGWDNEGDDDHYNESPFH